MHARIVIVVNPERREELALLLDELDDTCDVALVEPDGADDLPEAARDAASSAHVVAAIGGDGTQRSAAHVLRGTDAALAVVPGGTVNLLARVLGLATVADAARAIEGGRRRTIDTGLVGDETFVLNASTGYDAVVMRRVDEGAKRWGRLGYFVTGLRTLWSHRPRHTDVVIDGTPFYRGRAMTVMVTNIVQRGAADFTVALGGAADDGLLDVVVQRCDTVPSTARTLWALSRERTPRDDDLLIGHGRTVDVSWSVPVASQRDGDAAADITSAHYEVDEASLVVCVPVTD